jgi:hypothetical protein
MGQVLTRKLWASPQQPIALQDSLLELGERAGAAECSDCSIESYSPREVIQTVQWTPTPGHVT